MMKVTHAKSTGTITHLDEVIHLVRNNDGVGITTSRHKTQLTGGRRWDLHLQKNSDNLPKERTLQIVS